MFIYVTHTCSVSQIIDDAYEDEVDLLFVVSAEDGGRTPLFM